MLAVVDVQASTLRMNDQLRDKEEIIFRHEGTKYYEKDLQKVAHYLWTRKIIVMLDLTHVSYYIVDCIFFVLVP